MGFENLPTVQQWIIIGDNNNHNNNDDEDGDDDDDVIFQYSAIAQTGFVFWGLISQHMKQSWKDRATDLNRRPVPGLLAAFPHVQLPGNLEDMVINVLYGDSSVFSTTMHWSINREQRTENWCEYSQSY